MRQGVHLQLRATLSNPEHQSVNAGKPAGAVAFIRLIPLAGGALDFVGGQRVRDVRQGANGALYVVTDERNGEVWRIAPGS